MAKRAVIVGVDDYSTQFPDGSRNLAGCVADATSMYYLLTQAFGFDPSQTWYYADADASRDNILTALRYITSVSEPGDTACWFYAGHGARLRADPADPASSRYYEAIVPASGDWITDWEVYSIAGELPQSMVNFTIILDCCHAGGFSEVGSDMRRRTLDYSQDLIDAMVKFMHTVIPCGVCLPPGATVMDGNVANVQGQGNGVVCSVDDNKLLVPLSKSSVVAACRYDELDIETNGHGALTQAFLDVVDTSNLQISYRDLIDGLRAAMQGRGLSQTPTLLGQQNRADEAFLAGWSTSA
jgi:Caspase domain